MSNLTDKDLITFGKHKGKELQDVPAQWLMWYYNELTTKLNKNVILTPMEKQLHFYIDDNLDVLKKEIYDERQNK